MSNLLPLVAVFASSFVVAFSGAIMPGPLLATAIGESTYRGFIAGPLLIFGHAILEIVLLAALLFGLSPFFARDDVFVAISFLGGGILLWMAVGMFRSLPGLTLSFKSSGRSHHHLILRGIVMSLSNPYWTIWWATIGLGYIMHSKRFGVLGVAVFFIGHVLADFVWYSSVSYAVGKGRRFFSDRVYRRLVGILAVLLAVFAVFFIASGLKKAGAIVHRPLLSSNWIFDKKFRTLPPVNFVQDEIETINTHC
jgi:threonine/homoserine/homoserine lactone efflux protein